MVFLDLANAFGPVPHEILSMAFNYFSVPNHITGLVKTYFQDLQFCVTAENTTTAWQHLGIGVMAGCMISPPAFIMATELVMWASLWVVGGERLKSRLRQQNHVLGDCYRSSRKTSNGQQWSLSQVNLTVNLTFFSGLDLLLWFAR